MFHAMAPAFLALIGCTPHVTFEPAQDHSAMDPATFAHYLAEQPMVSHDEAMRAVLTLSDGEDRFTTFDERRAELESRGVVRGYWMMAPNRAVDRGTFAYMLFKACNLSHSVNTWLSSGSGLGDRRYALKRVAYARIMPYGLAYQIPTGGEVVNALAGAGEYLEKMSPAVAAP
jgi:hypothetical protein